MECNVDVRCIVCPLSFCCADCRRSHEIKIHSLSYECPICRNEQFLCSKENTNNEQLMSHIVKHHLPLYCRKCDRIFKEMEDLLEVDKCVTISDIKDICQNDTIVDYENNFDDQFNLIYDNVSSIKSTDQSSDNIEAIVSVNKSNRTAVITPVIRKKRIVEYEVSSESELEETDLSIHKENIPRTPHAKQNKNKIKRAATPHVNKARQLLKRQLAEDQGDHEDFENNNTELNHLPFINEDDKNSNSKDSVEKDFTTPSRGNDDGAKPKEITTPKSNVEHLNKLGSAAVTTSTPTNPVLGPQWSLFQEHTSDSPLSEIEGTTDSPAESIDNEGSKSEVSESRPTKLKSIITTGSKLRLDGQDSSEKQTTFPESINSGDISSASRIKKVKFAEDTIFEQENKFKRVFRKPKRVLTPGPQRKNRQTYNPRFQALINRFESQGHTMARTPQNNRDKDEDNTTPPVGDALSSIPIRAIKFKEDSNETDILKESPGGELFRTCVESPEIKKEAVNKAVSAITNNIANSLQTCLVSALQSTDEETEIQFKFVITKKKVSVKKIFNDGTSDDSKTKDIERCMNTPGVVNKENIWSTVAKVVKHAIWGDNSGATANVLESTTPLTRSWDSDSTGSSGSKRKLEEISDCEYSPLNHKRHKYDGRIRGRPPLNRYLTNLDNQQSGVSALRASHSAEQHSLIAEVTRTKDENLNQSF